CIVFSTFFEAPCEYFLAIATSPRQLLLAILNASLPPLFHRKMKRVGGIAGRHHGGSRGGRPYPRAPRRRGDHPDRFKDFDKRLMTPAENLRGRPAHGE